MWGRKAGGFGITASPLAWVTEWMLVGTPEMGPREGELVWEQKMWALGLDMLEGLWNTQGAHGFTEFAFRGEVRAGGVVISHGAVADTGEWSSPGTDGVGGKHSGQDIGDQRPCAAERGLSPSQVLRLHRQEPRALKMEGFPSGGTSRRGPWPGFPQTDAALQAGSHCPGLVWEGRGWKANQPGNLRTAGHYGGRVHPPACEGVAVSPPCSSG